MHDTSNGTVCAPRACAWIVLLAGAVMAAAPALAHDFWIQPDAYRVEPGRDVPLSLQVGHGQDRERSAMPLRRVVRFEALAPGGKRIDLRDRLHLGKTNGDATVRFDAPGLHVVALTSDDTAISRLPADKFNAYLAEEGLTPAVAQRKRTSSTNAEGVERYGRRTKALVQVGPAGADPQPSALKPLGMTLELVPEANPYARGRASQLPIRVYYQGKPLAGALVKRIDLDNDTVTPEARRSDAAGRVRFAMPTQGRWLLNVVWTRPLPAGSEVAFETVFSSLAFGFPQAAGGAAPAR